FPAPWTRTCWWRRRACSSTPCAARPTCGAPCATASGTTCGGSTRPSAPGPGTGPGPGPGPVTVGERVPEGGEGAGGRQGLVHRGRVLRPGDDRAVRPQPYRHGVQVRDRPGVVPGARQDVERQRHGRQFGHPVRLGQQLTPGRQQLGRSGAQPATAELLLAADAPRGTSDLL